MRGLISDAREIAKLCRELAEAREARQKAEAEAVRLKTVKDYWANLWADLSHAAISDNVRLEKRAEKAEAEVESLTEKLTSLQTAYLQSVERDNNLTQALFDSRAEVKSLTEKLTSLQEAYQFYQEKPIY